MMMMAVRVVVIVPTKTAIVEITGQLSRGKVKDALTNAVIDVIVEIIIQALLLLMVVVEAVVVGHVVAALTKAVRVLWRFGDFNLWNDNSSVALVCLLLSGLTLLFVKTEAITYEIIFQLLLCLLLLLLLLL